MYSAPLVPAPDVSSSHECVNLCVPSCVRVCVPWVTYLSGKRGLSAWKKRPIHARVCSWVTDAARTHTHALGTGGNKNAAYESGDAATWALVRL